MRKKGRAAVSGMMGAVLFGMAVVSSVPITAWAAPEIVAGGYEIDMEKLPRVHFSEHKDWETLYETAWESHKSNIREVTEGLNEDLGGREEKSYYVDEAFDDRIFQWDTMFMMLFDKYGYHEFPTLNSIDNFYYHQHDEEGTIHGYICRMINEKDGTDYYSSHLDMRAVNPPMFAWAEWEQYQIHGDVDRFTKVIKGKTILERLDDYFQYVKRTRTHKSGPAEGLYASGGEGSGLDNTPGWQYQDWNQGATDLSMQQVQAAHYISRMAQEVLDKKEDLTEEEKRKYENLRDKYETEAEELKTLIQEKLWSEEDGYFFRIDKNTGEFVKIATPMGLWSLAADVATKEQADRMIRDYTENSDGLFRPNGLATVSYDHKDFHSVGGYWQGAMWSPASCQWLKGLQQQGYGDLAFEEAVRHVNNMADVCKRGAYDEDGNFLHTLWENYSTEYSLPGSTQYSDTQPCRPNFVGWAGTLGIGAVLENIVGVDIHAPENTIDWQIRLTEAFGVDNLYFCGPEGENFVDLSCEERISDTSGAEISVKADHDFFLHVTVAGQEETIEVKAGEHSYTIDGEDGEESHLGIRTAKAAEQSFAAEKLEEADSAVVFGEQETDGETVGLPGQIAKGNKKIFNVNTVGFFRTDGRYPTELRDSASLQGVGVSGAKEYVKSTSPYGGEGFMFMAPASNELQTVKALIGVKNGTAKVEADLLDASEVTEEAELSGGEEETVYAVEVPFCAAGDTELMVTVTMEQENGVPGEISLKAILLEEGGTPIIEAPTQVKAESVDSGLKVSASAPEGMRYDSYRIYYKKAGAEEYQVKETKTLPCLLDGLENYKRYEVFVTGWKDGTESLSSESVSQIPEKETHTDAWRAYSDWLLVQKQVLNGNADFAHVKGALDFHVTDTVYGTEFAFSSDSLMYRYGLRADGSVENPVQPMSDMQTMLTAEASCGAETVKITVPVTLIAKEESGAEPDQGDTQVMIAQYAQPGSVDLTEEGCADWKLFHTTEVDTAEKKKSGQGIENLLALQEITKIKDDPSDAVFSYSDGTQREAGQYDQGVVFEKAGNGIAFDLPGSGELQEVKVYLGAWCAKVKISATVRKNGKDLKEYTEYFDTGVQASEAPAKYETAAVRWEAEDADTVLHVEISNETLYDEQWGNMNLSAITLRNRFSVNTERLEHGSLIVTNPSASAGDQVTVFAVPEDGYRVVNGSLKYYTRGDEKGTAVEGESFRMPHEAVTLRAEFQKVEKPVEPQKPVKPEKPVVQPKPEEKPQIRNGQICSSGSFLYKVTDVQKRTVEAAGIQKDKAGKLKKINLPDTVQLNGESYRVTAVAASAFKGNKKVTSAVIGKNVKVIGSSAFKGCKSLKKVTVKSTKLSQIGSSAFSGCGKLKSMVIKSKVLKKAGKKAFQGIHKKAVIKVPAAKLGAYRKILAKKGQSMTVKIKK